MNLHDPALHVETARIMQTVGQDDLSLAWLLSALKQDASFAPAHAALAEYYERHGDAGQAAEHRRLAGAPARP